MAFIDEVVVDAKAGRGGDGVVRWLHAKGKDKGGPAGGDGGKGGDVLLVGVRDLAALASYRFAKKFRAEPGDPGDHNNRSGAGGKDSILKVPIGTVATVLKTGETYEILEEATPVTVFRGGIGGFGNAHFKGSTNQNPQNYGPGKPGEGGNLKLSLKLIADAGLVGLPNAGKSSLLNALTNARSKVGAYAFTTLDPHLGDFYGYVLADIPGLIEGASAGRGLGSKFLQHVERTRFLVHLISAEQEDPAEAYMMIRRELDSFGRGLGEKQEIAVLSKTDLIDAEEQGKKVAALEGVAGKGKVLTLSVQDPTSLAAFSAELSRLLAKQV